jgi:hypothetical protein
MGKRSRNAWLEDVAQFSVAAAKSGPKAVVSGPPDGESSDHADSATCKDGDDTLFGPPSLPSTRSIKFTKRDGRASKAFV